MKKSLIIAIVLILVKPIPSNAETIKSFLKTMNGQNTTEKTTMKAYWRGILDTTMYAMLHDHIKFDITDKNGLLNEGKLCAKPKKYPTENQFFEFYNQYINAEIESKGKEAVEEKQMDQIMFSMWLALFNCRNPIWNEAK